MRCDNVGVLRPEPETTEPQGKLRWNGRRRFSRLGAQRCRPRRVVFYRRRPARALLTTLQRLRDDVARIFPPVASDGDIFLFARVGDEIDGVPLSVISGLPRLGLDPWQEAGRLSSLTNREAIEQLARLIAELPGLFRLLDEAREIADRLVQLPPRHDADRRSTSKSKSLVLPQTGAVGDIPTLGSLSRARDSRPRQRNPSRWASVRNWKPLSVPEDRDSLGPSRFTGGRSVNPSEDRGQQRGARSDHLPA